MPCTGGPPCPFLGRRSDLRVRLPRPTGWGTVPRYTYRRLAKLPSTADQLRRHTVLNLPGMLHGLSFEHTVMEPGAAVPISSEDETGLLIFTIAGRGVMVLDGDRIEVSANDLVHIPARSEEHTSELQSQSNLVCRLLLEKKKHRPRTADASPPRSRSSAGTSVNFITRHATRVRRVVSTYAPPTCLTHPLAPLAPRHPYLL